MDKVNLGDHLIPPLNDWIEEHKVKKLKDEPPFNARAARFKEIKEEVCNAIWQGLSLEEKIEAAERMGFDIDDEVQRWGEE